MQLSEIKLAISQQALHPTIISYADSNHYLLGIEDEQGNFKSARDKTGKLMSLNSITQAEALLKQQGIHYAMIQIQTAYDEMIGNSSTQHCRYRVEF
ncbi:DUF6482 family protein [Shewanella litoralis]|uniref:Uncharacterized protein n=1 Tax=Shewanella litoralis TaxID=2282700 RepID=A0ABQ2R9H8_9GAMM|nr:DUF6482 family protein [Shewanella litoralis]GGQ17853.1 hypothetical protein GCM10009411_17660 [Shewanella litoralis]